MGPERLDSLVERNFPILELEKEGLSYAPEIFHLVLQFPGTSSIH